MTDITKYGAIGNGVFDCSDAIDNALKRETELFFPNGTYAISRTISIPSNRKIVLDEGATIFAMDSCFNKAGVKAVITNADYENGNENIVFMGGKVNANNDGNHKEHWRTGPSQSLTFSFINVKNLTLKNINIHNSENYFVRFVKVSHFLVEDLLFTSDICTLCQDGIHLSGYCHDGVIRNIVAKDACTGDDLIALNADDVNFYSHNWEQIDGPISDILVENVTAEACHSAVRLLSITSEIRNVTFRNFTVGVREMGINADAARYCADPLFNDDEQPRGVGNLKNVTFENLTMWKASFEIGKHVKWDETVKESSHSLLTLETNGNLTIKNFVRDRSKDTNPKAKTIKLKSLFPSSLILNGENIETKGETTFYDLDTVDLIMKA